MFPYCTVGDVVQVARPLGDDLEDDAYNGSTIDNSEIEGLILEASYEMRTILNPNFSLATIEGLAELPLTIRRMTACKVGVMYYDRYPPASSPDLDSRQAMLRDDIERYRLSINSGILLDATTGEPIPSISGPALLQQPFNNQLTELYKYGNRRY